MKGMQTPFQAGSPIRNDVRAVRELGEFVRRLATDETVPFVIQAQAIQLLKDLQK